MDSNTSFQQLISAVRDGDDVAAEQLVRQYEPELRVMARVRLTDPSLRRTLDSMDVCQSIMGNFFVRAASGEFEIDSPAQLLGLLAKMLRNKVIDYTRKQKAEKRPDNKVVGKPVEEIPLIGHQQTPSAIVRGQELLERFNNQLTDEERLLVEQRKAGVAWADIARELGGSPEALRKQHARAIQRAAVEMGLEVRVDE